MTTAVPQASEETSATGTRRARFTSELSRWASQTTGPVCDLNLITKLDTAPAPLVTLCFRCRNIGVGYDKECRRPREIVCCTSERCRPSRNTNRNWACGKCAVELAQSEGPPGAAPTRVEEFFELVDGLNSKQKDWCCGRCNGWNPKAPWAPTLTSGVKKKPEQGADLAVETTNLDPMQQAMALAQPVASQATGGEQGEQVPLATTAGQELVQQAARGNLVPVNVSGTSTSPAGSLVTILVNGVPTGTTVVQQGGLWGMVVGLNPGDHVTATASQGGVLLEVAPSVLACLNSGGDLVARKVQGGAGKGKRKREDGGTGSPGAPVDTRRRIDKASDAELCAELFQELARVRDAKEILKNTAKLEQWAARAVMKDGQPCGAKWIEGWARRHLKDVTKWPLGVDPNTLTPGGQAAAAAAAANLSFTSPGMASSLANLGSLGGLGLNPQIAAALAAAAAASSAASSSAGAAGLLGSAGPMSWLPQSSMLQGLGGDNSLMPGLGTSSEATLASAALAASQLLPGSSTAGLAGAAPVASTSPTIGSEGIPTLGLGSPSPMGLI